MCYAPAKPHPSAYADHGGYAADLAEWEGTMLAHTANCREPHEPVVSLRSASPRPARQRRSRSAAKVAIVPAP